MQLSLKTLTLPLIMSLLHSGSAIAQIVEDGSLPQSTRVTVRGETIEITGGTRRGNNLFHSFDRFSIRDGQTAFFNNDAAIENILGRVTGRERSQIDGLIQANGNANLFLLNPNGILFGRNARLDIGGSFIGSSATSLEFADGTEFSAVNPQAPLLTVSVPIGLQFGRSNPEPIRVQGTGNNLFLNSPDDPSVNRRDRPLGLQVNSGETLALIGGDLSLQGGNLTAAGGRIELGSVESGRVTLMPTNLGWRLGYESVDRLGEIRLTQAASLEVSGDRAGEIQVQGRSIEITQSSALLADTLGGGTGGSLRLQATDQIRVTGSGSNFVSRLSTDVAPAATGRGGNLAIATPRLEITNGAQISSGTFGSGDAGSLQVRAGDLFISGGSQIGASGLFTPVAAGASGNGGRLFVRVDRLRMSDGAEIAASTFGAGDVGTLNIEANQIQLDSGSGLFATVELGARGNGDRLTVTSDRLRITGGAQISTLTAGSGNAGDLIVRASDLELSGVTNQFPSALLTLVTAEAAGQGGNLTVIADRLQIQDGAQIATTTFGEGTAGNLTVRAGSIDLIGGRINSPSSLVTGSFAGSGDGGDLLITTDRLRVLDGAQIATATAGAGDAGNLTIAAGSIELSGDNDFGRSGLFASAISGTGAGGNLRVTGDRFVVQDGAIASASNFSSSNPAIPPGQGSVGNLAIDVDQILLDRGLLTADSAAGDRGNIVIRSNNLLLRRESAITTNAQGAARGGNITIDSNLLSAIENSDITANAVSNFGGQVTIRAEAVLGTQIRPQLTNQSDITASSDLGASFSGTVQLDAPIVDPSQGLVELPDSPIDSANQIAAACAESGGNEFVITGRGGLPEAPTQLLRGGTIWEDLRAIALSSGAGSEATEPPPSVPVEAQGWQIDPSGQVVLIAGSPPQTEVSCAANPSVPAS